MGGWAWLVRFTVPLFIAACAKDASRSTPDVVPAATDLDVIQDVVDLDALAAADRAKRLQDARSALDGGTWTGADLYATAVRTSVMSIPEWPPEVDGGVVDAGPDGPHRLGYLRHGSHAPVFPERIVNEECPEGWYELLEGGFVCGKYASLDPKDPAVKFAANPPDLTNPMPYRYGSATGNDTPVYRRVLSLSDRRKYEPWLVPPPAVPSAAPSASTFLPTPDDSDNPYEDDGTTKPKHAGKDAGARDAGIVKLGDLKGHGVLARKMMKGFYVALDRDFTAAKVRWWRTAEGFAIPYDRIALQGWSPDFHGSWIVKGGVNGGAPPDGNGTAALVRSEYALRYVQNDKGKMAFTTPIAKWTALELVGEAVTVDGVPFQQTTGGFFVRLPDVKIATPEKPADVAPGERWIDVDLQRQILVAFEGDHPVYATLVSSGRRTPWDLEHDHPTPTGTFRIYEKHVTATMDGDVASDGPYSIEDVPWVMFFQGSYALHGAFWHNLFGTPRSHGCVNLSPIDARELFFWTEPRLPKGWHGVFQTGDHPGTRLIIHEPPPPKK